MIGRSQRPLPKQYEHKIQIFMPPAVFLFFFFLFLFSCSLFVLKPYLFPPLPLIVLAFCILSLLYTTQTSLPPVEFFCSVFVLHPYFVLFRVSCLLPFVCTYNTNTHAPVGIRTRKTIPLTTFLVLSLYFICTALSWLSWLCLFVFTVQHNYPGAGRDSNPQFQKGTGRTPSP